MFFRRSQKLSAPETIPRIAAMDMQNYVKFTSTVTT